MADQKLVDMNALARFKEKYDAKVANEYIDKVTYISDDTKIVSAKLPTASTEAAGAVTIGNGLKMTDGKLTLDAEKAAEIVGVADDNIAKDSDVDGLFS